MKYKITRFPQTEKELEKMKDPAVLRMMLLAMFNAVRLSKWLESIIDIPQELVSREDIYVKPADIALIDWQDDTYKVEPGGIREQQALIRCEIYYQGTKNVGEGYYLVMLQKEKDPEIIAQYIPRHDQKKLVMEKVEPNEGKFAKTLTEDEAETLILEEMYPYSKRSITVEMAMSIIHKAPKENLCGSACDDEECLRCPFGGQKKEG